MSEIEVNPASTAPHPTTSAGVLCFQCGYDLRAAPVDGNCPECGEPCMWSAFWFSPPAIRWRRLAKWGALLLIAHVGLQIVTGIALIALSFLPAFITPYWAHWALRMALLNAVLAAGVVLLTTIRPHESLASLIGTGRPEESRCSGRRIARWATAIGAGGTIASPFVDDLIAGVIHDPRFQRVFSSSTRGRDAFEAWIPWATGGYGFAVSIVFAIGMLTIIWHLGQLATDVMRATSLARQARIVLYGYVTLWLAGLAQRAAYEVPVPGKGAPLLDPMDDLLIQQIIGAALMVVVVVYSVWYVVILWSMSRRLGRGLKESSSAAAGVGDTSAKADR